VGHKFLSNILHSNELEYYEIQTLQIIIQFLYSKIRRYLMYIFFPLFLVTMTVMILFIFTTEDYVNKLQFDQVTKRIQKHQSHKIVVAILVIINTICIFIQIFFGINSLKALKSEYFFRFYSWVDIVNVIVYVWILSAFIKILSVDYTWKDNSHDFEFDIKMLRTLLVVGVLTLFVKLTYFLSLIE